MNAIPGSTELRVWWFKKVEPVSAAFSAFYVPAKVARYTVSYPANPATIVLASNAGSGDLSGVEIAGRVYVQNDRTQPGFNPNEEHALMIGGRAYALRDDLNNTSATPSLYTSQPFVLLSYNSAADDSFFDYPVTAGTIIQPPMPLPLLPLNAPSCASPKRSRCPSSACPPSGRRPARRCSTSNRSPSPALARPAWSCTIRRGKKSSPWADPAR